MITSIKKALDLESEAEFDRVLTILDGYCRYKDSSINYKLVIPRKYIDIILNWKKSNSIEIDNENNILRYKGHTIEIKD